MQAAAGQAGSGFSRSFGGSADGRGSRDVEHVAGKGSARLRALFGSQPAAHLVAGTATELAHDGLRRVRAADAERAVDPAAIDATVLLALDRRCQERQSEADRHDEEEDNDGGPGLHGDVYSTARRAALPSLKRESKRSSLAQAYRLLPASERSHHQDRDAKPAALRSATREPRREPFGCCRKEDRRSPRRWRERARPPNGRSAAL